MDFLKSVFITLKGMLTDWPIGTILGHVAILIILILIFFVMWGALQIVDSWFLPVRRDEGLVIDKTFIPSYIETIEICHGEETQSRPHRLFCPEEWLIGIEIHSEQDTLSVPHELFNSLLEGDAIVADYTRGRIWSKIHIIRII